MRRRLPGTVFGSSAISTPLRYVAGTWYVSSLVGRDITRSDCLLGPLPELYWVEALSAPRARSRQPAAGPCQARFKVLPSR